MRVLVTGCAGQLGQELSATLVAAGHECSGCDLECDISSPVAVRRMLNDHRPAILVNCAAYTRVDDAETHADDAYRVNALGPRVLAAECHASGVQLCHISTDYVFDGEKGSAYDEWDSPHPLNVYGASKLAGEHEVQELCADHLIVRTAWLYGRAGPNFILTILRRAREGGELRVVADQSGSPTWTGHLAPLLIQLLELGIRGVVHAAGSGATTWHSLAEAAVQAAGLDVRVQPVSSDEYPVAARRPRHTSMDSRVLHMLAVTPMPPWREGLTEYVRQQTALSE